MQRDHNHKFWAANTRDQGPGTLFTIQSPQPEVITRKEQDFSLAQKRIRKKDIRQDLTLLFDKRKTNLKTLKLPQ